MLNEKSSKEHFIALEWLRLFLGIYIAIFHTFHYKDAPSLIREIFGYGFFATSTFFILSGFLLSHVYLKNHGQETVYFKESSKNFIIKRFSNLYPIHIFSMLIYIFLILILPYINSADVNLSIYNVVYDSNNGTPHEELKHKLSNFELMNVFLMNVFMLQAWNPYYMTFNFPAWSISTLFFFYILFPFIAKGINKVKNLYIFLLVINLIYIIPAWFFIVFADLGSPEAGILHRNPLIRLPEFISGIVLCAIYHRHKLYDKLPKIKQMIIITFILFFGLWGAKLFLKTMAIDFNSGNIGYQLLHNGMILLLEVLLIYYFININPNLSEKVINISKRLASSTLPIFVLHIPINMIFIRVKTYYNIDSYYIYLVYLFLLIYISIIFQEKIVVPVRNKIQGNLIKNNKK